MRHLILFVAAMVVIATMSPPSPVCGQTAPTKPPASLGKVYGEWLIRVRPDKGKEYNQLIEQKGLPLFREAGGRMVGWWTTLVGDLYEHVTIWEYDDMAAFEKAVGFLGKDPRFAEFVTLRDPLLDGEISRFLRPAGFGDAASLPEKSKFVLHEIHRVPLKQQAAYMKYMEQEGMGVLKKNGFRISGPYLVAVGQWTDVTYLLKFDSLAERDQLIGKLIASTEGRQFADKTKELTEEITSRLLMPAPFAN